MTETCVRAISGRGAEQTQPTALAVNTAAAGFAYVTISVLEYDSMVPRRDRRPPFRDDLGSAFRAEIAARAGWGPLRAP